MINVQRLTPSQPNPARQPNQPTPQPGSTMVPVVPNNQLPKGLHNNFIFEFANAVMWQSFGSPVILFIRQSGASDFIVGALSAIPLFLMPLTLISSRWVESWGYRRTAIICWTFRWLFCSLLIWIAVLDFPGFNQWRVPLVLGVIFLFHLMRNFGVSANTAWQTSIIPPSRRGLFLSRATLFANLASVVTFLIIGIMLGDNPTLSQYGPVFVLGVVGGFFSSIFMARIQPPPVRPRVTNQASAPRMRFWPGFKKCFARPGFRSFLVVQTFYGIAFQAIPSLSLIYLNERVNIASGTVLYFSMFGVGGATVASIFWGRWIDRRGVNSLQLLGFLGMCFNSILWFGTGLLSNDIANIGLAALVSFLSAVWLSALTMSQTHTVMTLAPDEDRVLFQNIATFMVLISQALAPMVWGFLLDTLDQQHFTLQIGSFEIIPFRLFYLASMVIGLVGAVFLSWLQRKQLREAK